MTPRHALVLVSAVQLAAGLAGLAIAVRRRRNFDVWLPGDALARFRSGSTDTVPRDALWAGTAYSAPVPMLLAQAWGTASLARRRDDGARRVLGMLGAVMVPGYLLERWSREHLRHVDPVETPVVVAALGLATVMAVLGHRTASAG